MRLIKSTISFAERRNFIGSSEPDPYVPLTM